MPALAQSVATPSAPASAPPAVGPTPRVGVGQEERRLSLEDAVQLALKNNLEIEVSRTDMVNAEQVLKAARGVFDTVLSYKPSLASLTTPTASSLAAADGKMAEHDFNNDFTVRQKTPWQGMSLHADFLNQRQSTNNPFTALSPFTTSRIVAGLNVPLLRNRAIDSDRAQIGIRMKQVHQSKIEFEVRVIDVVTVVQGNYWDLVAAIEDASVAQDGVRLAQDQLDRSKRQVESGTLAPVEISGAEAELQRRVDSFVTAVGLVTNAENALKLMLTSDRGDALWGMRLAPTDVRVPAESQRDLEPALDEALKRRAELHSVDLRLEALQIQTSFARDSLKPQLNLTANYTNSGLAGAVVTAQSPLSSAFGAQSDRLNEISEILGLPPLPPLSLGGVPPAFIGGYGQTLSNLFSGNFQSVDAALTLEWTPRNRTAEATLAQSVVAERRLKLQRRQLEQLISVEVRNALQGIETARQRIEAATASERAAKEKLDSEIRLFQTGESTNFLVLTRQNELLDSRRRAVQAELQMNRAVARLRQVTGETLEANRIKLD
jgi:HAE1 family hydrophobic/amphiphilic exporter-1